MEAGIPVGLVGCGRWGRLILRDLVSLGCQVAVAVASEQGRRNAAEGGAAWVVEQAEALPPVAGLVVASPSITHADVVERLLPRGVPIFVEKPLTTDAASAARLAAAAPERLFVMDKWRYHPGIELLARIARTGELGPVLGLHSTRAQWGNPHQDVDGLWILAPHDLSIALEILGDVPPARAAVAEVTNGEATGLMGLLGDAPWFALEVSTRYPTHRREVRLHCRDGVALLDDGYSPALAVTRAAPDGSAVTEQRPLDGEMPLLKELRTFVAHLAGGPPPRSSAAEGALIVQRIAELRALAGLS